MDVATMPFRQTYHPEVTEDSIAERLLWLAVITLAVEEWRSGALRRRREAQQFLFEDGADFEMVCASAGLDPANLRSNLLKIGRRILTRGSIDAQLAA